MQSLKLMIRYYSMIEEAISICCFDRNRQIFGNNHPPTLPFAASLLAFLF
jgi:hypothetical protein